MALKGNTYDVTFDYTFRGLQLVTPPVNTGGCREQGIYMHWLGPTGWAWWLFTGKVSTNTLVESLGTIKRARLMQDTQREDADVLTIRTGNLTYRQAKLVSTIYKSIAVFVVNYSDDSITYTPVYIEPGNFPVWETGQNRGVLEVAIRLPGNGSQRL